MPWSTEDLQRLVDLESQRQNVDPRLSRAVVSQESEWNPNAVGDNGNSIGLFQLQPGAAKDAGLHPRFRSDPAENIKAGVTYLKQKLTQSGGNVEQALSRYNRGTPEYRGIGDPNYVQNVLKYYPDYQAQAQAQAQPQPRQQPGILNRAASMLSPASAEASTPSSAGSSRLQELEAELARRDQQTAPQAPTPPTATSTPEQDAAYRDLNVQQGPQRRAELPPVSQTTPATQTQPGASQTPSAPSPVLERFGALPSIKQLPPAERQARQREFAALTPALQEEFLRSEEPPSDLTVDIEKPSTPTPAALAGMSDAQRTAQVRQELAAWEQQAGRPWREGDPRMPSEKRLGVPDEAPVTESITAPSTMIPLLMPGAGLTLVPGALKTTAPLVYRGARAAAEGLSQTAGWTAGRTAETGAVPSPGEVGTEVALNVAAGGILEGLGATGQAILRRSQAGKAIVAADEATTAARATWQADTQAAEAAAKSQQKELYDTAVIKAKASQRDYEMAARQRQEKIAASRAEYDEAVRAQQADDLAKEQARQQTMTQQQQTYQQAVTGQQQAITQARAVPGRYTPETPSWVQYEKFGDAAKDAVVDLTPAKAALAEVRASRGVLPDGTARPLPAAVESIAANLEKATGDTSFKTIREELRRLGPLTRSQDGNVRGAAKQVYGIYADVLEASPMANDLLRNANATFRKEMAVQDIADWLKPGHGIVRIDKQGRETINVGALMTRLEKTVADDSLFRRSFAPNELDALRADMRRLAGTPDMPRGVPREPAPVVPGRPPAPPREPAPVALPADVRVTQAPQPRPMPEPVPVTPREALGERPRVLGPRAGEYGAILATLQALGIPTTALAVVATMRATQKQGQWLLAHALLSEKGQKVVRAAIDGRGTLNPRVYGALIATLTPEEKKAYARETRETRR